MTLNIPMAFAAVYFDLNEDQKVTSTVVEDIRQEVQPERHCSDGAVYLEWPSQELGLTVDQLYLELCSFGFGSDEEAASAKQQFAKIDGWLPPSDKSVVKL